MDAGIAKCGRLEQYFKRYRECGARPPQAAVDKIRQAGTLTERAAAHRCDDGGDGGASAAWAGRLGHAPTARHRVC